MRYTQHVWLSGVALGAFVAFGACNTGQYQVGSDADSAGNGPTISAGGPGVSGAHGVAGGSSDPGGPSFCGMPLPTDETSVQFAPPSVVFRRLSKFLLAVDQSPPSNLPTETTRQWAGDLAASTLASLSTPSAKGMDRFVTGWWTGTPAPEQWAAYFSSKHGSLPDLLSTDSLLPNGAGMLTDPAVLNNESYSARGEFVLLHLLCVTIPTPDPITSAKLPPLMRGQTRRSQLEATVWSNSGCKGCHQLMDPFGYPLGEFTTDGNFQTRENDLPIDTQAALEVDYHSPEPPFQEHSETLTAQDAQNFGSTLANGCAAAICLTRTLLQDAADSAGLPNSGSEQEIVAIAAQFTAAGLSLPELVRLVVGSDVFLRAD